MLLQKIYSAAKQTNPDMSVPVLKNAVHIVARYTIAVLLIVQKARKIIAKRALCIRNGTNQAVSLRGKPERSALVFKNIVDIAYLVVSRVENALHVSVSVKEIKFLLV